MLSIRFLLFAFLFFFFSVEAESVAGPRKLDTYEDAENYWRYRNGIPKDIYPAARERIEKSMKAYEAELQELKKAHEARLQKKRGQ